MAGVKKECPHCKAVAWDEDELSCGFDHSGGKFHRIQDGHDEGARVYHSTTEAMDLIKHLKNAIDGDMIEVRLFELGKEIPIEVIEVDEPQPPKKTTTYQIKRG